MIQTEVSKVVHAPIDRVFEIITDLEGSAETIRGIEEAEVLTDGPIGVGTRWRETRVMFGKRATEEMEITAFEPPNGGREGGYIAEAHSHGSHYVTPVTVVDQGDGTTKVSIEFQCHPQSIIAKLMMKVFGDKLKGYVCDPLQEDLLDIKRAAEAEAQQPEQ